MFSRVNGDIDRRKSSTRDIAACMPTYTKQHSPDATQLFIPAAGQGSTAYQIEAESKRQLLYCLIFLTPSPVPPHRGHSAPVIYWVSMRYILESASSTDPNIRTTTILPPPPFLNLMAAIHCEEIRFPFGRELPSRIKV